MRIVLAGWNPGFNKVGLTKLLHTRPEFSLSHAKAIIDAILDGQSVTIEVPDNESERFTTEITSLGLKWKK